MKKECSECHRLYEPHVGTRGRVQSELCATCRKLLKSEEKLQAILQKRVAGEDKTVYVPLRDGMRYFDSEEF